MKKIRVSKEEIIALVREKYQLDASAQIMPRADFHVWGDDGVEIEDVYVDVIIFEVNQGNLV